MSEGKKKERRSSRDFPESFRSGVVSMMLDKGMTPAAAIEEFHIPRATVYRWLDKGRLARGLKEPESEDELTKSERAELKALRKQVRELKLEAELIKKWAAFFAKETGR